MMRCDDVIRELATPTDARDTTALTDHLNQCSVCAAWAQHAARLDRLWQVTQPVEPTSDAWDNLWAQVISSLDAPAADDVRSAQSVTTWNGSANSSPVNFEVKAGKRPPTSPFRFQRWSAFNLIGLAQAAAVLFVVGMSWRFFVSPRPPQHQTVASLPSVDIDEGQVVMIVADPKLLSVVDMTPKSTTSGVDHVDWYGDEKYFDWFLVYHEVESLAKPTVAMKE